MESTTPLLRASVCSESKPGWVKNQLQHIFGHNDNKLAMKLFGSKKAFIRPKAPRKTRNWVIHPMSQFRWVRVDSRMHMIKCNIETQTKFILN